MKISVIVPIYNAEDYLLKSISAISCQTYKNLEIILIDDGSTDGSLKLCQEFAQKDDRIKVYTQKNKGVASARNKGISVATGDYIGFADCDDLVSFDMYEVLADLINKTGSQIVGCQYSKFQKKPCFTKSDEYKIYGVEEGIKALLKEEISNFLWDKLFDRKLFGDLSFKNGIIYEDFDLLYKLLMKTNNITITSSILYGYYQRPGSYVHSNDEEKVLNYIEVYQRRYKYLNKCFSNLKEEIEASLIISIFIVFRNIVLSKNIKLLSNSKVNGEYERLKKLVRTTPYEFPSLKKLLIKVLCLNKYLFYFIAKVFYKLKGDM